MGGLIGGEAAALSKLEAKTDSGTANACIADPMLARATTYAMAVLETNASMGRIVAAPTAGSSGVVPAMLLAAQDEHGFSDEELINALANAAAIGYLITRNATVAGAEGGCQAEAGSASAMAASAACELFGGNARTMLRGSEQCALRAHGPCVRPRRRPGRSALPETQRHGGRQRNRIGANRARGHWQPRELRRNR